MNPQGPFVIAIRDLEQGETRLEMVGTTQDLGLGPEDAPLAGPVILRATVFRTGQNVEVQATLTAGLDQSCDRCLEPVETTLRIPLRVFAERREGRDRRAPEEVREENPGFLYHDGQFVELTDEVRQALLVEVPWHVVCDPSCRGLCPRCGGNLNRGACVCRETAEGQSENG